MKKILFILRDFKQGGIPRCLESLMYCIDLKGISIDVCCLHQDGPYKDKLPNCTILPQDKALLHLLSFSKGNKNIKTIFYKIIDRGLRQVSSKGLINKRLDNIAKKLSNKYNAVIAYSEGIAAQLAEKISTPKRFVWIHNDYAFDCARGDVGTSFENFNKIITVSKATQESFNKVLPQFSDKTLTIYNFINQIYIEKSADAYIPDEFSPDFFNIVSVGRICYQKNFIAIPRIISELSPEIRSKIRWYIIGGGPKEEVSLLKEEIKKRKVDDNIILLGSIDNPYPYLKRADLFVLTSNYESYPTVINEALVLETPILAADIPPVHEMLKDEQCISEIDKMSAKIDGYIRLTPPRMAKWTGSELHNQSVNDNLKILFDE